VPKIESLYVSEIYCMILHELLSIKNMSQGVVNRNVLFLGVKKQKVDSSHVLLEESFKNKPTHSP
jgi:hypothetical protein